MDRKNKSDTSNNRGNRNHLRIIQKNPEKLTGKGQHQGTAANSHIVHCTLISRSTNVKVQNIQNGKLHVS